MKSLSLYTFVLLLIIKYKVTYIKNSQLNIKYAQQQEKRRINKPKKLVSKNETNSYLRVIATSRRISVKPLKFYGINTINIPIKDRSSVTKFLFISKAFLKEIKPLINTIVYVK